MGKKVRLDDKKATALGLELKKHTPGRKTAIYYLNDERLKVNNGTNTTTKPNDYKEAPKFVLSAWDTVNGGMMDIDAYCVKYALPRADITSYKLVSHTGTPFYNIVFKEQMETSGITETELKEIIAAGLTARRSNIDQVPGSKTGVVKIADLHLGAYIDGLIRTKEFSIDILATKLRSAAAQINRLNYKVVHVHILGDIIESFTGLNHKNSWKGLDKGMVGAEAVKLSCEILHTDFLNRIKNLDQVKLVAGNHDRTTSNKDEDVDGDAANLVGWGLRLIGYNVEFNPLVITHVVDGICHILTHGHHGISKKSTQQICWDYGAQGKFNLITEGHLHSTIEKLSVAQRNNYQTVKDDAVDHKRMNCPSFFTGNFYSESLGYTSQAGFVVTEDNGAGVPNIFNYAV